ncbi:MAG TPA: Rieske 2Fe-2S domain-containing protein [Candidatus Limnocylindrales bacterium]|nr:Rieske 2Fe-2S domain-containing protein [Candidatus Limnocylindrales bacterium]
MARWLARVMDAQDPWVKPLGEVVHRIDHAIFHAVPEIRDLVNGRWLGHPIHAVLTDVPIGILFLVIVLDVVGQPAAAGWALGIGVLSMAGAAVAGFADYADTDGTARERATLHSSLMVVALVLYLIDGVLRLGGPAGAAASGGVVGLSVVAFLVLSAGAYVGGDIVYVNGNMVDRHAFRGAGTKWITLEPSETEADGAIPEGRPIRAKLGLNTLVLVRNGAIIMAVHDTCAHAGGPLSDGALVAGPGGEAQIECPWHESRYRLFDGRVVRGPSVYDQPSYEVRPRDGGGWEARRRPS